MSRTIIPANRAVDEPDHDPVGMVPPDSIIAAEQSVLGAMMLSNEALADVRATLAPSDFYRPAHSELAQRILDMAETGTPVDPVAVLNAINPRDLNRIGGGEYVHTLTATVPTAANASYYAEIVVQHARQRATIRTGMRLMQLGRDSDPDAGVAELADRARSAFEDYEAELAGATTGPATLGVDFDEWFAAKLDGQPPVAYTTGLADLDQITDVRPGELLVIAARPSIGKTLLGVRLAIHTARQGSPVLLFSLEMTRSELLDRVVAAVCSVDHGHLRDKQLTAEEQQRITARRDELRSLPLYVEDASELTMSQIKSTGREYRRRHGIEMVLIDYLGLVRPDRGTEMANRERQVAEMSGGSKTLAKELQVPVVLVVQINRGPESRTDKSPQLSDLRESGAIEADANQVWLLHRPEFTAPEADKLNPENHPGEVQIAVAKNRGGKVGSSWFAFRPHNQDISNLGPR